MKTSPNKKMKVVIIAAGMGSRIRRSMNKIPKTLLPYKNGTVLSVILENFNQAGIFDFVIVVGYKSEHIKGYLKENRNFGNRIEYVDNTRWQEGNGISVLVSESVIQKNDFILSMSDHVVSPAALKRIKDFKSDRNLLLVDTGLNDLFDIDDATKVKLDENHIINIGKTITDYNGADCGIFRLTSKFFEAMRHALKENKDSISAAINHLIDEKNMDAVFIEKNERWFDIDTLEAHEDFIKVWDDM